MDCEALISPDSKHRLYLRRTWDITKPTLGFVMLNPSTADATVDDPTIRKCIGFAKRLEQQMVPEPPLEPFKTTYGGIYVTNLFTFRATSPDDLRAADPADRNGYGVDDHIRLMASACRSIIVGWGAHGDRYLQRVEEVYTILTSPLIGPPGRPLPPILHLGLTKSGQPRHPLYIKYETTPKPWVTPRLQTA